MDINIRIAGEAGQGVQTTGNLLVDAFASMGLHVFATQSYMSRIRGGLNWFDVSVADVELFAGRDQANVLVALTPEALATLRADVVEGGVAMFDGQAEPGVMGLAFTQAAKDVAGSPVMANTVAAGAVFALLGYDLDKLCGHLSEQFKKKGDEVALSNVRCARRGAQLAGNAAASLAAPQPTGAPAQVCNGSQAIGLGAATAGVKFVSAYPMTPATGTFTFLASVADEYGIVVEQAEDEIAAVNMVCGATYAGVPAMTMTSGGGFALMCEGLSLAAMLELPIVILDAQRPGPATGLPTRTGQQDLKFVVNAGHGEFPRAVYAPGAQRQAYELTRTALQVAHKCQSPAILLADQFLADAQKNIGALDRAPRPIDRCIVKGVPGDYVRYAVTKSGVSPRAIPGAGALVVCDSDEHTEDGHITEDLDAHIRLQDKRMAKNRALLAELVPPERYGPAKAEEVLVCWGSTYGPCREAVDILAAQSRSAAMLHFSQVWPIDTDAARKALGAAKRIIMVEGNQTAQFASLLREVGVLTDCDTILKYNGMPFTGQEIAGKVAQ